MSNYNARVPADQQYHLIMKCRSSGLSDYQWCKVHTANSNGRFGGAKRLRFGASG